MQGELTTEHIIHKLLTDTYWLECAVLAIYRRQTSEEQNAKATIESNGRGFSGPDAHIGSYMAKWLLGGPDRHLTGKYVERARKIMPKYAKQLLSVATDKARQAVTA